MQGQGLGRAYTFLHINVVLHWFILSSTSSQIILNAIIFKCISNSEYVGNSIPWNTQWQKLYMVQKSTGNFFLNYQMMLNIGCYERPFHFPPISQTWKRWMFTKYFVNNLFLPLKHKETFPHTIFQWRTCEWGLNEFYLDDASNFESKSK